MKTIYWSEPAKLDYWNNINYLQSQWTQTEVYNFIHKTDKLIDLLAKGTVSFKPTLYKSTFKVPVVKQIILYYCFENDKIILLRFWNNYQDFGKFKL
jgi:hypothetical protein